MRGKWKSKASVMLELGTRLEGEWKRGRGGKEFTKRGC